VATGHAALVELEERHRVPNVDISVRNLVDVIDRGELRLLELQRRYVWPAARAGYRMVSAAKDESCPPASVACRY
jgi:hypothetical protein